MTFQEALSEQMKDETFKKEYDALKSEYDAISSLIDKKRANQVMPEKLAQKPSLLKQM